MFSTPYWFLVQVHESKGCGDTFDVSWSHDSTMLSACFSSGLLHVLDYSSIISSKTISVIMNGNTLS